MAEPDRDDTDVIGRLLMRVLRPTSGLVSVEGLEVSLHLASMHGTLWLADVYDRFFFPPKTLSWYQVSQQEAEENSICSSGQAW